MKMHCCVYLKIFVLFALSVGMCASSIAQVTVSNSKVYADYLTVKFNIPVVDMPAGQTRATLSDIKASRQYIRTFFTRFSHDVVFEKVIVHANPEDTVYTSPSGEIRKLHDWSQVFRVIFPQPIDVWNAIEELHQVPEVEYAQPPIQVRNDLTPNDLHLNGNQWYLPKVQAEQAWGVTTGSSSLRIALIEGGVTSHNDLAGKLVGGETGSTGDHGVMVAGVAGAATNNGIGIASLGWNVLLVPMNYNNLSDLDADIVQAARPQSQGGEGARVINCSFKTITTLPDGRTQSYNYPSVEQAVATAAGFGALVVASAGNPPDPATEADVVPFTQWPAAYTGVIAVSATNSTDQFPPGFNYGTHVDVSGPAIDIQTLNLNNGYSRPNGTSFAAPLTSAMAGLIWSKNPNLSAAQVAMTINLSADDLGSAGWDDHFGYGRINANKAVRNLYVPQVYATIEEALSLATTGQTVVVGAGSYSYNSNLTIPSGITLQLNPGVTLSFSGYYKLTVNGILVADGATFQGNGTKGSWFGIELNNWSIQLTGWTIKDAQYGLFLANSNMAYPGATSFRNNTCGIYISGYSDPILITNGFTSNSMDVFGDATSVPDLGSAPGSGYNSFRSVAQVNSWYPGTIFAWYNWWGSYPPNPNVSENVDYTNALSSDPNPLLNIARSSALQFARSSTESFSDTEMGPGDDIMALNDAHRIFLLGNHDDALNAFHAIVRDDPATFAARRAVVFVERCLEKLGRSKEISEYLNALLASNPGSSLAPFLQFREAVAAARMSNYSAAIAGFADAINAMIDTTDLKIALYAAGSLAFHQLNDHTLAESSFHRLIVDFPNDALSQSALLTLGEAPGSRDPIQPQPNSLVLGLQPYPNPFNPSTAIRFSVPQDGFVSLAIYDAIGRTVTVLVNERKEAGSYQVQWNASHMPSGVYFSRLESQGQAVVQKLVLVR